MLGMSSTEYLDQLILDSKGLIVKETMDGIKGYCGLFAFVLSILSLDQPDDVKVKLINNIINSTIKFTRKKYEANLEIYNNHVSENLEAGKLFHALSVLPAKLREDFEAGLIDAENFLRIEIEDIFVILQSDLKL